MIGFCGHGICVERPSIPWSRLRPDHGEGDDDEQGVELGRVSQSGVFQVQAPGLCIAEQALDAPTPAIMVACISLGSMGRKSVSTFAACR